MIRVVHPTCTGLKTINTVLTCYYDQAARTLKITNAVDTELSIENEIEFTVSNFVNPFNSIEKSGFQVTTMERTGTGKMDESAILSITVTDYATLLSPSVSRGDFMTTVGEFSSLTFSFSLNLPVDPGCRLKITFPSD